MNTLLKLFPVFFVLVSLNANEIPATTLPTLINWSEPVALEMLARSDAKVDFAALSNNFESQTNKLFCGPTTAAIVLNALRASNPKVKKPSDPNLFRGTRDYLPKDLEPVFERYTQFSFFNDKAVKSKSLDQVLGMPSKKGAESDYGLQLRQLNDLLKAQKLKTDMRVVTDKLSEKKIKTEIIKNLKEKDNYVIVNYARKSLGQKGGGHISPLAAYDSASDSFLILDVNPNTAPWVWVKSNDLIAAMRTHDTLENRGYILVEESSAFK